MNNLKRPLVYTDDMKDQLEKLMSGFTYGRAKKWSTNKSFYRFRIAGDSLKIVVAPTRCVDKTPVVYYDDKYAATWVINSYYHRLNPKATLKVIFKIGELTDKYETQDFLNRLATIAKQKCIDPKKLEFKSYIKNGIWFTDYVDADKEKYVLMINEITDTAIKEYKIKQDKIGIAYYVVRNMAHTLMASLIDNEGGELTLKWYYRKL